MGTDTKELCAEMAELDDFVARHVMGWERALTSNGLDPLEEVWFSDKLQKRECAAADWRPSALIDEAMQALEVMLAAGWGWHSWERFKVALNHERPTLDHARLCEGTYATAVADTLALALCRAMKKAVGV